MLGPSNHGLTVFLRGVVLDAPGKHQGSLGKCRVVGGGYGQNQRHRSVCVDLDGQRRGLRAAQDFGRQRDERGRPRPRLRIETTAVGVVVRGVEGLALGDGASGVVR